MGASPSKEMEAVDLDEESRRPYQRRESGEQLRSEREPDPFDDVTPTRSLAEVGLADMDEDLPTKMQSLDELARLREAGAGNAAPPGPKPYAKVAFRSFPAPAEKPASVPPPANDAIEVPIEIEVAEPSISEASSASSDAAEPEAVASETTDEAPRSQRAFVVISIALLLAAIAILASDHLAR